MTDFNKYIPVLPVTTDPDDDKDTNCLLFQILIKLGKIETHLSLMTEVDLDTQEEERH